MGRCCFEVGSSEGLGWMVTCFHVIIYAEGNGVEFRVQERQPRVK